jgi:hypothetical protein
MAEQVPSATEPEPGDAHVIVTAVALRNPERVPEHELLENPIPALKKEPRNGSLRQKTFSNRSDTGLPFSWRNTIENGGENGASVTTRHVFWPNQRRNPAALLPIWQPNSNFLRSRCKRGAMGRRHATACAQGGRRGSKRRRPPLC